jgi:hypothetical protein
MTNQDEKLNEEIVRKAYDKFNTGSIVNKANVKELDIQVEIEHEIIRLARQQERKRIIEMIEKFDDGYMPAWKLALLSHLKNSEAMEK